MPHTRDRESPADDRQRQLTSNYCGGLNEMFHFLDIRIPVGGGVGRGLGGVVLLELKRGARGWALRVKDVRF